MGAETRREILKLKTQENIFKKQKQKKKHIGRAYGPQEQHESCTLQFWSTLFRLCLIPMLFVWAKF